jgi:hypothetical protein
MKETLKLASLLGYQFPEVVIVEVAAIIVDEKRESRDVKSTLPGEISSLLTLAIKEGSIEETKRGYQFSHDRLQTAF